MFLFPHFGKVITAKPRFFFFSKSHIKNYIIYKVCRVQLKNLEHIYKKITILQLARGILLSFLKLFQPY